MSLLDDEDIDVPLQPGALSPVHSEDHLGTVATNPLSLLDDGPVVLSDTYSGGNVETTSSRHTASLPRMKGSGGPDVMADTTPVKHSKLTKFMAGRKKSGKGSFHVKKGSGPSPPPSPKIPTKGQSSSDQSKAGKHQYSTLRDSPDVPDDLSFRTSPLPPPAVGTPGTKTAPQFPSDPFPTSQGSVSSADIGSELTSPVSTTGTFSPTPSQQPLATASQPLQGLSRPGRQSQPQTATVSMLAFPQGNSSSSGSVVPGRLPPPPQGQTTHPIALSDDWVTSRPKTSPGVQSTATPEPPISSNTAQQVGVPSSDPWTSTRSNSTTSPPQTTSGPEVAGGSYDWSIADDMRQKFIKQFNDLNPDQGQLKGEKARQFFVKSKLPNAELSQIWKLSDVNEDNALSEDEFCIAMKLVVARRKGIIIPPTLPSALRARPSSAQENTVPTSGQTERQDPQRAPDKSWARFSPTSPTSTTTPNPAFPSMDASPLPPPPQPARKAPLPPKAETEDPKDESRPQHSASSPPTAAVPRDRGLTKHQRSKSSFDTTVTSQAVLYSDKENRRRSYIISDADRIVDLDTEGAQLDQSPRSAHREVRSSSTGQIVELDSQSDLPFPVEGDQSTGDVIVEPLYTAVIKTNKTKKADKLVHFDKPPPEGSDGQISAGGSTDGELVSPTGSKPDMPPGKRKPKRPPPPVPTPFAEHRKKSVSPEPEVPTAIPSHYETAPLVDLGEEDTFYETVDAPLITKPKPKPPVQPKPTVTKLPGGPAKPKQQGANNRPTSRESKARDSKGKDKEKDAAVKLPGLEKSGGKSDEITTVLEAMKARGHTRTSSLDSKKKEIASTAEYQNLVSAKAEYQNLVEGLPPAIPPALPPKPKKKNHLEEPPRTSGGRILSRSASLDSINSLSGHTGPTTSPVPKQKSEWKEPPQVSPRTKKKPLPLPSTKTPIQPMRKPGKTNEPSKNTTKPSSSSEALSESKPLSRHQPVAAPDKSFSKVVQELEVKRSPSPAKPPPHKSGVGSHGADVLSVAIAIAEKASVLPSSNQMSGVRDKAVVQQAIRTLKEEISTLKLTNSELQSQLTMLMEERNRLRRRADNTK